VIKILHTADLHLGRSFTSLRDKAREHRRQLLKTFEEMIELAIKENVSLVLIAGDLFDSNREYGVVIGKVLSAFKKLWENSIPICIIPGTHDCYDEESIYRFIEFPPNVTVFTPEISQKCFDDLNLVVYGKVFKTKTTLESPLRGLTLVEGYRFHIGLVHASVKKEGLIDRDSLLIEEDDIANSGLDYLALGHWHSFKDCSKGKTKAFYSGSPEPIYMDQKESGSIALVSIEGNAIGVKEIKIGSKRFDELKMDIGPINSVTEIIEKIEAKADSNLILKVTLEGLCTLDLDIDEKQIEEDLKEKFFNLQVSDEAHPKLEEVVNVTYPDSTVIGKYITKMQKMIVEKAGEERELYEEALKLGFALLQGRTKVIE